MSSTITTRSTRPCSSEAATRIRNVAITGADGFIGKHLTRLLAANPNHRVVPVDRDDLADTERLASAIADCDTIVHLAASNRGEERALYENNVSLVQRLCQAIRKDSGFRPHVLLASSTQRQGTSIYAQSKRDGETVLREFSRAHGFPATILVIPNVFGPGCRPNYNSVIATFCHQLARGEQPVVQGDREIEFIFVTELAQRIAERIVAPLPSEVVVETIAGSATTTVGEILNRLREFRDHYFGDEVIPPLGTSFERQLYATWMSHVEPARHSHEPKIHTDERGALFEIIKTAGGGQVFFSTTRPGVVRGNHFHTRKIEWFCVVRGEATIRLRRVGEQEVHAFRVSGCQPRFISIPPFHTHSIENVGQEELLTMFWCSELFVPADPDTYFEKVA